MSLNLSYHKIIWQGNTVNLLFIYHKMEMIIINREIIFDGILFKETKYENYFVSKCGKIISIKKKGGNGSVDINNPRYPKLKTDKDGYLEMCISMMIDGKHKRIYRRLHRLVYETWVGEIKYTINHIDMNKQNNNIDNLEDITVQENSRLAQKSQQLFKIEIEGIDGAVYVWCNYANELVNILPINDGNEWGYINKGWKLNLALNKKIKIERLKYIK